MFLPDSLSCVTVAVALLAAGAGRRMGGPKASVVLEGERLLDRAIRVHAPTYAIVRAGTSVAGTIAVVNPDPDRGLRSSLELAVAAAHGFDALAVTLVDMPWVPAEALHTVIAAWRPGRATLARYVDGSGHPTVLGLDEWTAALAMAGPDEGARGWLRAHPSLVDLIDVPGSARDLDTPEDLP